VTSEKNESHLMPRFFWGADDEVLFSTEQGNIIYNINSNSVYKYLEIENAKTIFSFAHALGLYSFLVSPNDSLMESLCWTCYVNSSTKDGKRFRSRSEDTSIFLSHGIKCGIHKGCFVSFLDFNSLFRLRMPEMNWSNDSLKKDFFEITKQIDKNKHNIVVLYRINDFILID
jgi:hypothetical protein